MYVYIYIYIYEHVCNYSASSAACAMILGQVFTSKAQILGYFFCRIDDHQLQGGAPVRKR